MEDARQERSWTLEHLEDFREEVRLKLKPEE